MNTICAYYRKSISNYITVLNTRLGITKSLRGNSRKDSEHYNLFGKDTGNHSKNRQMDSRKLESLCSKGKNTEEGKLLNMGKHLQPRIE